MISDWPEGVPEIADDGPYLISPLTGRIFALLLQGVLWSSWQEARHGFDLRSMWQELLLASAVSILLWSLLTLKSNLIISRWALIALGIMFWLSLFGPQPRGGPRRDIYPRPWTSDKVVVLDDLPNLTEEQRQASHKWIAKAVWSKAVPDGIRAGFVLDGGKYPYITAMVQNTLPMENLDCFYPPMLQDENFMIQISLLDAKGRPVKQPRNAPGNGPPFEKYVIPKQGAERMEHFTLRPREVACVGTVWFGKMFELPKQGSYTLEATAWLWFHRGGTIGTVSPVALPPMRTQVWMTSEPRSEFGLLLGVEMAAMLAGCGFLIREWWRRRECQLEQEDRIGNTQFWHPNWLHFLHWQPSRSTGRNVALTLQTVSWLVCAGFYFGWLHSINLWLCSVLSLLGWSSFTRRANPVLSLIGVWTIVTMFYLLVLK